MCIWTEEGFGYCTIHYNIRNCCCVWLYLFIYFWHGKLWPLCLWYLGILDKPHWGPTHQFWLCVTKSILQLLVCYCTVSLQEWKPCKLIWHLKAQLEFFLFENPLDGFQRSKQRSWAAWCCSSQDAKENYAESKHASSGLFCHALVPFFFFLFGI